MFNSNQFTIVSDHLSLFWVDNCLIHDRVVYVYNDLQNKVENVRININKPSKEESH